MQCCRKYPVQLVLDMWMRALAIGSGDVWQCITLAYFQAGGDEGVQVDL